MTDTGGRAMHWRSIRLIADRSNIDAPAEPLAVAVNKGWIEVNGGHSVCLTDLRSRHSNRANGLARLFVTS